MSLGHALPLSPPLSYKKEGTKKNAERSGQKGRVLAKKEMSSSFLGTLLSIAAPFIAALISCVLPLPESLKYVLSNVISQICAKVAERMTLGTLVKEKTRLIIPALSTTGSPSPGADLNQLFVLDFLAAAWYVKKSGVPLARQILHGKHGREYDICSRSDGAPLPLNKNSKKQIQVRIANTDYGTLGKDKENDKSNLLQLVTYQNVEKLTAIIEFVDQSAEESAEPLNEALQWLKDQYVQENSGKENEKDKKGEDGGDAVIVYAVRGGWENRLFTSVTRLVLLRMEDEEKGEGKKEKEKGGKKEKGNSKKEKGKGQQKKAAEKEKEKEKERAAEKNKNSGGVGFIEAYDEWGRIYFVANELNRVTQIKTKEHGTISITKHKRDEGNTDVFKQSKDRKKEDENNEYYLVRSDLGIKAAVDFLEHVRDEKVTNNETDTVRCLRLFGGTNAEKNLMWVETSVAMTRTPENSFFTREVEEKVFAVMHRLNDRRADFERLGLPTRTGFLLAGPPGTGKSTIPSVVANMLGGVPLVSFDLAAVRTGSDFITATAALASYLPSGGLPYVISFDDVEKSAFFKRFLSGSGSKKAEEQKEEAVSKKGEGDDCDLSTFLNWLDGVCTSGGRIVFMTVNDSSLIEKIDAACSGSLLRFGRIDHVVNVGPADTQQFSKLFEYMFGSQKSTAPLLESIRAALSSSSSSSASSALTIATLQQLVVQSDFDAEKFLELCESKLSKKE